MQQYDEVQKKLTKYYDKLTLAQRLGIVEKPPRPLDQEQWKNIEDQSKKREDSDGICPICLEDFKN